MSRVRLAGIVVSIMIPLELWLWQGPGGAPRETVAQVPADSAGAPAEPALSDDDGPSLPFWLFQGEDANWEIYGLTRVWHIHLIVTPENWEKMQPAGGGFRGWGQPRGDGARGEGGQRPAAWRPGSFGLEFEYAPADVELDGERIAHVGLRFKGNGSYVTSASGNKRPFKIDFDRYEKDGHFRGIKKIGLSNNVMDPSRVREALAFRVFEEAGTPASRTAYAEVYLTIVGQSKREFLGLYTWIEQVDAQFLERHFESADGLLLKPVGTQGLEYKGDDWSDYEWYNVKTKANLEQANRLIEFTRLIHEAEESEFRERIGEFVDLRQFASFLAANALLANMDSYLSQIHNYYLYLVPSTNRFVFVPWDLDLAMGAFFMAGSPEQLSELSIQHPHIGEDRFIERVMEMEEFASMYRDKLRSLLETCLGEQGSILTNLPLARSAIDDIMQRESEMVARRPSNNGPGGFGPWRFENQPPLETFVAQRAASVRAQLAGESEGFVPERMSFGPPRGRRP